MAQPQYNDTDFSSLAVHVFDVIVDTQAAGTFTVFLDDGPYTGTGATKTLIRDALKTSIDAGTHINWTAADQGTDAVRITATGPGQHIGGGPGGLDSVSPSVTAPVGGALSLVDVVPFEGIDSTALIEAVQADVLILTPLVPRSACQFKYVTLDASPRVVEFEFTVDPLPAGEKTALDALVAAFTNVDTASILLQFARTAAQDPAFVHFAANFVIATKGSPDFGLKVAEISPGANAQDIAATKTTVTTAVGTTPVLINYDSVDNAGVSTFFTYSAGTITIDKACRLHVYAQFGFSQATGSQIVARIAIHKNSSEVKFFDEQVDNSAGTNEGIASIEFTLSLVDTDTIEIFASTASNTIDIFADQNCMTALVIRGE